VKVAVLTGLPLALGRGIGFGCELRRPLQHRIVRRQAVRKDGGFVLGSQF